MSTQETQEDWHHTACILCSQNCGLEVQTEGRHITKIRGDKAHPISQGYLCQKAQRIDYYQNNESRVTKPLRRKEDGTFEEVSWDTAIQEIADKLKQIRDEHGGHAIAQFGGGGQGNHLNGAYTGGLRAACGTRYLYSSLAQEKTGGFWVNGRFFGTQDALPIPDHHHGDFLLAIGWNPWQSHGTPRARNVLQQMSKDPNYTLVVVDPRRTQTAEKADYHVPVRPGGDAHLMLAMLGIIVQEGLEDKEFLAEHCLGVDELLAQLRAVPVEEHCEIAGVDVEQVREITRKFAAAKGACVHTDLGLEHTLHSTLNQYLSKLLWLITGNFGKPGGHVLIQHMVPLVGQSKDPEAGGRTTKVANMREIGKLYPPNYLPYEIDTDHPDRLRALWVDSGNPAMTAADAQAVREAFKKLELLVCIDVAMTETARLAHYVLPAQSQYEKWECTFFNFGFPENAFHLRRPLFEPTGDTLTEAEIYFRIVAAMGEIPTEFPELEEAARQHMADPTKGIFGMAFMQAMAEHPDWARYTFQVLYATLGKALPDGAAPAALLWGAAQKFAMANPEAVANAGIVDEGAGLGEALFQQILNSPSGVVFSKVDYDETWKRVTSEGKKIGLVIPEMMEEIAELAMEELDAEYPFILQAGERRDYNANQIIRGASWRKKDPDGFLRIHPEDAAGLGVGDGERVSVKSERGAVEADVTITDEVQRGFVTLPHGYGMHDPEANDSLNGPDINVLTDASRMDRIAGTPFHKWIPVQIVPAAVPAK